MAVAWGRRMWNYPTNHETTFIGIRRQPGTQGQMGFSFQGSDTGQHRLQTEGNQAVHEYSLLQPPP